uniref:At2g30680 n=1 Tax=Arabidopsis thaliana TaxID=3702 RepID=Q5XEN6_ARATH|nr:At2g30680 [Arabidopsis thaliana]AAW39004.1 At2g30680 [Arabidopsis thaliana]
MASVQPVMNRDLSSFKRTMNTLAVSSDVAFFNITLRFWIRRNDETREQGKFKPHTDLPRLQSFYLDYYQKNVMDVIKIIGNQYTILKEIESSAHSAAIRAIHAALPPHKINGDSRKQADSYIQHACDTAGVLFRVLELLSEDVQLPSEFLEADADVKQLAEIFRPYNIIPLYICGKYSMKRLPELQAAIDALSFPLCTILPLRVAYNPSPARDSEDLPAVFEISPREPILSLLFSSILSLFFSSVFFPTF